MKKWTSVLAMFVATLMIVGGAMAQGAGGSGAGAGSAAGGSGSGAAGNAPAGGPGGSIGTPGTPTTSGSDTSKAESPAGTPSGGAAASGTVSAPSASPATGSAGVTASADFTGRHTMDGEVVKVDQKKGHVTLKTAEGNMDLHFPPSALQNVKKGDRIAVELAMKPAGQASMKNDTKGSASPKTEDTKKSEQKKY